MSTISPIVVSSRLDEAEQDIIKRIQSQLSRPGLAVTASDAVKVALHAWAAQNPEPVAEEKSDLPEN